MSDHRIIIRPEAFGCGFDIVVDPPAPWGRFEAERPTHRAARRYADSLHTVHGWRIVDQTGGEA